VDAALSSNSFGITRPRPCFSSIWTADKQTGNGELQRARTLPVQFAKELAEYSLPCRSSSDCFVDG
jgi:hypothetical protein